jgi:ABC-type dipeptide/oligopeptide/nickel transport system ATPase component
MPAGCNFAPRCPYRFDPCEAHDPVLAPSDGRYVACWKHHEAPS